VNQVAIPIVSSLFPVTIVIAAYKRDLATREIDGRITGPVPDRLDGIDIFFELLNGSLASGAAQLLVGNCLFDSLKRHGELPPDALFSPTTVGIYKAG